MLEEWIAGEPSNKENTFEFYRAPKTKTMIYEDENGPVFAVRYSSALRTDMEFNPQADPERIRAMFREVVPDAAKAAQEQGFCEIVYESSSPKLIAFLRRLGFKTCPDYRKVL
jgi:hypothetical protein